MVSRVELTTRQVESIAQVAADSTAKTLLAGGTFGELLAASVEPDLEAQFTTGVWHKIPGDAQQALVAATFISKAQPPRIDFSGAVILDWKALEISLDEVLFEEIFQHLQIHALPSRDQRTLRMRLRYVNAALQGAPGDAIASAVRQRMENLQAPIRLWHNLNTYEIVIRNRAAHQRHTSRSDFERSRTRVFGILRALVG